MKGDPLDPAVWHRVAQLDLHRARAAIGAADCVACSFWLQQAAEKALKGWLIGRGWSLLKTHDLPRLATDCTPHGVNLPWFIPTGKRLTNLYFTDRYVEDSPDPEPDQAEMARLLADVEKLQILLFPPPPVTDRPTSHA